MFTFMTSELEAKMTSVERIQEYITALPHEPAGVIEGQRPPEGWPSSGSIEWTKATMR